MTLLRTNSTPTLERHLLDLVRDRLESGGSRHSLASSLRDKCLIAQFGLCAHVPWLAAFCTIIHREYGSASGVVVFSAPLISI